MKTNKKRNWAFVLYIESAPSNWIEILQQTGLPFAISPYHDKDINPNGEVKKPHFHIILCFDGPTTYSNVKNITDKLNQPIPIALDSVIGMYRYFTHKDNPEKYQYNEKDIQAFNGFDIDQYNGLTKTQIRQIKIAIQQFIMDNDIVEYKVLMDTLFKQELWDWHEVASTNTTFFNSYLTSKRNELKERARRQ